MAKEQTAPKKEDTPQAPAAAASGGLDMKKIVIVAVPLFVVQLVVVFFLVKMFLVPSQVGAHGEGSAKGDAAGELAAKGEGADEKSAEGDAHAAEGEETGPLEEQLYTVKDLIINPAGTGGARFLLTTITFKTNSSAARAELEKKDPELRDILNTVLTSKGMDELTNVSQRDSLRSEISARVGGMLKSGKLLNIYFSKYIVQ